MDKRQVFVGIDIGTQGVRMVWLDENGEEQFAAGSTFELTDDIRVRQDPDRWWTEVDRLFLQAKEERTSGFFDGFSVTAVGVTSTSGTIIPLDKRNRILYGAIMYSDPRSAKQGTEAKSAAEKYYGDLPRFTNFSSSCGLSKMLWFREKYKEIFQEQLQRFIHASDFITGRMTGIYDVTDHSNALKSGYDLHKDEWPAYIFSELNLSPSLFPKVKPIGSVIGKMKEEWSQRWGLPQPPLVSVGLTDGCASQIAAGAVNPGDWNTTIGTTLVLKGVTENEIFDQEGSIYCHRHPDGYWMPGGASNIGADWVHDFTEEEIQRGSVYSSDLKPSEALYYPLKTQGERFPFISPEARGDIFKKAESREDLFQAGLEAVAFIERYAYEKIEKISGDKVEKVLSAGGGNKNEKWLHIRANVLGKKILKSRKASGAVGAALVGASHVFGGGISETVEKLLGEMEAVCPTESLVNRYDIYYHRFINLLKEKGYINE